MTNLDRFLISWIVAFITILVLREGDHQIRLRQQPRPIVISVSGAVLRPGVIELPAEARAVHAIDRCGGLAQGADSATLQLARPLKDGDHLVIPRVEAAIDPPTQRPPARICQEGEETLQDVGGEITHEARDASRAGTSLPPADTSSPGPAPSPQGGLDVNRATVEELDSLPGIGPVLAQRIVEARQAAPGATFTSLEELAAIRGIKAKTFSRLKPYLRIEGS